MNQRVITFIVCLITSAAACAIQSVEAGLHPLYERIQAISGEQQLLDRRLQAPETSAPERALAWRSYQVLEKERQQLASEIAQAKRLGQSPLVTFMAPATEAK